MNGCQPSFACYSLKVNGTEMTGKSQGEAVNILRSTRGLVKLLIQREEIIQAPTRPVVEVHIYINS